MGVGGVVNEEEEEDAKGGKLSFQMLVLAVAESQIIYSISFFALKYRLRYSTCQVASPSRQHMLNTLKMSTR